MRGTTQFLDQLPGTVGVPTSGVQQGFAEGVTISLLANAGSLLPAHVFVLLLEVRAKPQQPRPPRGAAVFVQPVWKTKRNTRGEEQCEAVVGPAVVDG